ncbi:MAG: AAA family ATPase [Candidatus Eremiobacterota bacterium]
MLRDASQIPFNPAQVVSKSCGGKCRGEEVEGDEVALGQREGLMHVKTLVVGGQELITPDSQNLGRCGRCAACRHAASMTGVPGLATDTDTLTGGGIRCLTTGPEIALEEYQWQPGPIVEAHMESMAELRQLSTERDQRVLGEIGQALTRGNSALLVGPTGCGKVTLARRFAEQQGGELFRHACGLHAKLMAGPDDRSEWKNAGLAHVLGRPGTVLLDGVEDFNPAVQRDLARLLKGEEVSVPGLAEPLKLGPGTRVLATVHSDSRLEPSLTEAFGDRTVQVGTVTTSRGETLLDLGDRPTRAEFTQMLERMETWARDLPPVQVHPTFRFQT